MFGVLGYNWIYNPHIGSVLLSRSRFRSTIPELGLSSLQPTWICPFTPLQSHLKIGLYKEITLEHFHYTGVSILGETHFQRITMSRSLIATSCMRGCCMSSYFERSLRFFCWVTACCSCFGNRWGFLSTLWSRSGWNFPNFLHELQGSWDNKSYSGGITNMIHLNSQERSLPDAFVSLVLLQGRDNPTSFCTLFQSNISLMGKSLPTVLKNKGHYRK